ncbi:MAG: DUF2156 domain-containing protein [Bacillota bacterium]|jgi:hypothetical protein
MHFNPVTIKDKDLFNSYLTKSKYQLISYNFTSFFLWKDWEFFTWTELENALCIKSDFYSCDAVLPPISSDYNAVLSATERLIHWYKKRDVAFFLKEVPQDLLDLYEKTWPGRFNVKECPEGANYIYRQEDLAYLRGRKYNNKRNHVSNFLREYPDYQFVTLTKEIIPSCKNYIQDWFKHHQKTEDLVWERHGIMQGLEFFDHLDYTGACLLIDGRVEALTLGEPLNDNTFAIHVEKANPQFKGIYAAINQFFSRDFCSGYTFINRAEDMGLEGLRKAKRSYHPCKIAMKYYLTLK